MASLAIMAGGAIVNALVFSGTNFIFRQLEDHGKEEMKRCYLAAEQGERRVFEGKTAEAQLRQQDSSRS